MFCEECGNKIQEDAKFCPKCGTSCSDDGNMPETNGGTKVDKKPKRRRKKNKAVIALCTAVVIVGASVSGFALYKNYGKPSVIQKANDLDVAWGIFQNYSSEITNKYIKKYPDKDSQECALDCKISYDTAKKYIKKIDKTVGDMEKALKEETDAEDKKMIERSILMIPECRVYYGTQWYNWYNKVSDMKNVYNLYDGYYFDVAADAYTVLAWEKKKLTKEFDNLTKKDYSWIYVDSYRMEDGKIYCRGIQELEDLKIEGELLDQDVLIEKKLKETKEGIKKNKKSWTKTLKEEYEKQVSVDEALKEYEKYLNKWKNTTKEEDEDSEEEALLYRIKNYKDGTLFVEDCYVPVPDFSYFLNQNYEPINPY